MKKSDEHLAAALRAMVMSLRSQEDDSMRITGIAWAQRQDAMLHLRRAAIATRAESGDAPALDATNLARKG